MEIDPDSITAGKRYNLLTSFILPRPIALVTSLNDSGIVNAAPFSFFNCMGADPPIIVLGVGNRDGAGGPKDTAANIRRQGEFVVNVVTEEILGPMNTCAVDFPAGMSELPAAGLTPVPSVRVKPPRIAESPVNMECRELQMIEIGRNRIIMAQVVYFHIHDDLIDPATLHVKGDGLQAVGRLQSPGGYTRTTDRIDLPRMSYAEWLATHG